ncbi:MAG: hypothetical protein GC193_14480 [Cryomorphaceae bacterium]|nr:hypothetical protein [Cryomorphaceae bacterium]
MKLILLSLVSALWCAAAMGQTVVEDRDVEDSQAKVEEGPNTKYYQHGFLQFGSVLNINANDSAQVRSNFGLFSYGTRGKFKLLSWLAAGWDAKYTFSLYNIKQGDLNALADQTFKKQWLDRHAIDLGAHLRFNFDRRGNTLGKYLDLGGYGGFAFGNRMKFSSADKASATTGGSNAQRTVFRKLQYVQPLHYGLQARLGFNRFAVCGYWRVSQLFKKVDYLHGGAAYPELPRLSVAIELNF